MRQTMILTGEINLKTVTDPTVPFRRVTKELGEADLVFANLECLLADPPAAYATNQTAFHTTREGFYASPVAGEALKLAGFAGVGCANNVTYGDDAIRASLARLKGLGIPVTGAGLNREEAHRPLIIEKRGVQFGFMQRTSIFWPRGQAAGPLSPGVATLAAHTAYQPRVANRPGVPPIILTMADATDLTVSAASPSTRDTAAGTAPLRRSTGWVCWSGSPLRTSRSSRLRVCRSATTRPTRR